MGNLRIIVFNVEHGFCAFIKSPTGRTLLIDCGRTATFSPIEYVLDNELTDTADEGEFFFSKFILSHPHGDHLDDIDRLKIYRPRIMLRQKNYDWEEVKEANSKNGAKRVDSYKNWQATYSQAAKDPNWGFELYCADCLSPKQARETEESKMLNNSSIPVVIIYKGTAYSQKFLFPGDLEESGWLELLKRDSFKKAIGNTTFFVASHHGHSSGYCKDIFKNIGKPYLNIVSAHSGDESVESAYSKQESARGVDFGGTVRYMLSTRNDGNICINVDSTGAVLIGCQQFANNIA